MATGSATKPKEVLVKEKKNILYDMVKSDGQYKEVINNQELARDAWDSKWGFMKKSHILQIYEEEALSRGLQSTFMLNRCRKKFKSEFDLQQAMISSPSVPTLSSGMVGWRSSNDRCSLEIVGPLFTSPLSTIDPPRRAQDLPLHQTYIHLG